MARYYNTVRNQGSQNGPNPLERQPSNESSTPENQQPRPENLPAVPPSFQWPIDDRNNFRRNFGDTVKNFYEMIYKKDMDLFDDCHPFGLVLFSNKILQREAMRLFHSHIIRTLKKESWTIYVNSQDDAFMWERRFELMQECHMTSLEIEVSYQVKSHYLLKFIEPIGFPDLQILDLYSCKINSIEILAFLNAPKLKEINIIYNRIYSFKELNKAQFPFLKYLLLISTSEIQDESKSRLKPHAFLDNFSRWNFQLKDIRLQKHQYNFISMNDIGFLAKSKLSNQGNQLRVNVALQKRIQQKKIVEKFSKEANIKFQIFRQANMFQPYSAFSAFFDIPNYTWEDLELYDIRH